MKKTIITITVGILIGLVLGGSFWYGKYMSLNRKYMQSIEVVKLLTR